MTHFPREQLMEKYGPESIYPLTIGQGIIPLVQSFNVINILSFAYCGNGIVLTGTSDGHIWRDVNYGAGTWTDLGVISPSAINTITYVGNGIVILGDNSGNIKRSTDYGITWSTIITSAGAIISSAHFGQGWIYVGTAAYGVPAKGHIYNSSDFGANFADQGALTVGGTDAGNIISITFMDGPIGFALGFNFIAIDSNGKVFRTYLGLLDVKTLNNGVANLVSTYIGNGILLVANNNGEIYRSLDKGGSWNLMTTLFAPPTGLANMGNGIVAYCNSINRNLQGTFDAGVTWTNWVGILSSSVLGFPTSMHYLGNGVLVIGTSLGRIFRAITPFRTNEAIGLIDSSFITTTTSITIGQSHNMVNVNASGGNRIITLADATTLQRGHEFIIKKIDATTNTVTITPSGGQTIDGAVNKILNIQYQNLIIRTDGTNWFIASPITGTGPTGTGFILGQLKPNITRYAMPGWNVTRGDVDGTLPAGVICYIPFYYATTTTATEIAVDIRTATGGTTIDLRIFEWNDGVPGALFANLGTISGTSTGVKTIAISVTFPQGLYFMAMRSNNTVGVRGNNFSFPIAGPVGAMNNDNSGSPTDFCDQFITTVTAAYADPAPAPTGMQGSFPFFLLKEN